MCVSSVDNDFDKNDSDSGELIPKSKQRAFDFEKQTSMITKLCEITRFILDIAKQGDYSGDVIPCDQYYNPLIIELMSSNKCLLTMLISFLVLVDQLIYKTGKSVGQHVKACEINTAQVLSSMSPVFDNL